MKLNEKRKIAERLNQKDDFEELRKLRGLKVKEIIPYDNGGFSGFKIVFNRGYVLTANDGEYGTDAFSLTKKEKSEK